MLEELKKIYPSGYTQLRTDGQTKGYAREVFINILNQKITSKDQLEIALDKAREDSANNRWMPPPAMLISWCKHTPEEAAEAEGMPSVEGALLAACREAGKPPEFRSWPHCVVEASVAQANAAGVISMRDFKHRTELQLSKRWRPIYSQMCQRYLAGETIPKLKKPDLLEAGQGYNKVASEAAHSDFCRNLIGMDWGDL